MKCIQLDLFSWLRRQGFTMPFRLDADALLTWLHTVLGLWGAAVIPGSLHGAPSNTRGATV